jgi:histidyl-tRNA synthetase
MRVYVAREEGSSPLQAFEVVRTLRRAGLHAEMEQAGRSLKGQLRHAGRIDAETAVVVGPDGLRVRDLRGGGGEHSAADVREAVAMVAGLR